VPTLRIAILAAVLALVGCSNQPPAVSYSLTIERTFSTTQIDAISAGLDSWKQSLPELQLDMRIGGCDSSTTHDVCVRPQYDMPDSSEDVVGATKQGPYGDALVFLYLDRIELTGLDVGVLTEQTMAHEMGHVMGLQHSSPGALMAPTVLDQAHSVTNADVAQFWAVRGR
jgi:hypothetical protein